MLSPGLKKSEAVVDQKDLDERLDFVSQSIVEMATYLPGKSPVYAVFLACMHKECRHLSKLVVCNVVESISSALESQIFNVRENLYFLVELSRCHIISSSFLFSVFEVLASNCSATSSTAGLRLHEKKFVIKTLIFSILKSKSMDDSPEESELTRKIREFAVAFDSGTPSLEALESMQGWNADVPLKILFDLLLADFSSATWLPENETLFQEFKEVIELCVELDASELPDLESIRSVREKSFSDVSNPSSVMFPGEMVRNLLVTQESKSGLERDGDEIQLSAYHLLSLDLFDSIVFKFYKDPEMCSRRLHAFAERIEKGHSILISVS
jgi:hypothetical protein